MGATAGRGAGRARVQLEHPGILLLASGAAIAGIALLLFTILSLGARALDASNSQDVPCLVAVSDEVEGAVVDNELLPPRTTCTWQDASGVTETVVVAEPSPAVFWAGVVLFFGGVLTCVGVLAAPRLRKG